MSEDDTKMTELTVTVGVPKAHAQQWEALAAQDGTDIGQEVTEMIEQRITDRLLDYGLPLPEGMTFNELGVHVETEAVPGHENATQMELHINMTRFAELCKAHQLPVKRVEETNGGAMRLLGSAYIDHLHATGESLDAGNHILALLVQVESSLVPLKNLLAPVREELKLLNIQSPQRVVAHAVEHLVRTQSPTTPSACH